MKQRERDTIGKLQQCAQRNRSRRKSENERNLREGKHTEMAKMETPLSLLPPLLFLSGLKVCSLLPSLSLSLFLSKGLSTTVSLFCRCDIWPCLHRRGRRGWKRRRARRRRGGQTDREEGEEDDDVDEDGGGRIRHCSRERRRRRRRLYLSLSLSLTFFLILFSLFLEDAHASPATLPMVCARARAGSKDSDAFTTTAPPPHPSFSLAFFLN